ncbi:MAG TPA: BsuPI-related putative proteinase inhibitor [Gemmatimonadaceae bacterium]
MIRIRLAAIVAGAAFLAGCHSEPTAPDTRSAANDAAQQLLHLADSLQQHGGSAGEIGAYRGLASLLVGTGRLSSVTISVDDAASEYLATAQEIQFGSPCPPGAACAALAPSLPPDHAFIAWQKSDPRRMVQLFVPGFNAGALAGDSVAMVTIPSLLYFDGSGSLYSGATTTRTITVTTSDTPCTPPGGNMLAVYAPWPCKQAEFTVAFDGSAQLMPLEGLFASDSVVTPSANAAPSHRISMASQQVHGAHLEFTPTCYGCVDSTQPGSAPPVTMPWRDSLSATLTTTVGSDVTFTFTVTNTRDSTATVKFNDSQQFDIRVWDANDALVWRWGADQAFAQLVTTRALAPGESATYVAHWKPASAGSYHAMAYLTSSSHGAVAFANVQAP